MKKFLTIVIVSLVLIFVANTSVLAAPPNGDSNSDGVVNVNDLKVVLDNFGKSLTNAIDQINDGKINSFDFIAVARILTSPTPTPTPITTVTPEPTQTAIWISPEELSVLPMSGTMWNTIKGIADSSNLGVANLADQNNKHSRSVVALALVAARTNQESYKVKTANEIIKAIGTENNPDPDGGCTLGSSGGGDTLAVGRNAMGYAVAADILNLRPGGYDPDGKGTQIYNWLKVLQKRKNCPPHGGAQPEMFAENHEGNASNGNALNGASRVAISGYLRDKADLDRAWLTFRKYTGDYTIPIPMGNNSYSQTWLFDTSKHVGINPKGATKQYNGQTYSIDGVVVNDQGRGGNFMIPPGYTQYPWEGLQGAFGQAVILDRLGYKDEQGKDPWETNDKALLRALEYQWMLQQNYGGEWFDNKRAAWVKFLANKFYGTNFPTSNSTGGRNIDFTQWSHQ